MSFLSNCACCRHNLLRVFVSFAGVPIRTALKPNTKKLSLNALDPLIPIRTFSKIYPRRTDTSHEESIPPLIVQEEKTLDTATELDQEIAEPVSQQPWYLQVETPQRKLRSLSERQQLPELPPDPPPLLQPILEHISNDLGLDELSLFDLRNLDPPHALGANLLVILGTARSEKHLHVSADRFCRWLRTTHKLTPYADGLMGRGELKLKMRRKARRARILSRVGSAERYSQDDGLTTGWICVNVGTIEDGRRDLDESLEPEGFVGFGEKATGTAVVIQMLTEDKRMELDLEEVWENALKKQERKEAKIKTSSGAAMHDHLSDDNHLHEQNLSSIPSSILLSNQQKASVGNYGQRREFHNSSSRLESKTKFIRIKLDSLRSGAPQPDTHESNPNFVRLKSSFDTLRTRSAGRLAQSIKGWDKP
ncbi:ATPase synthesis protein 25 mitochondrial [Pseudocyphellaria aurata]|nr:ATPase synthesis protein 25 mitochondrial [Pseudocyphellaria aurata]